MFGFNKKNENNETTNKEGENMNTEDQKKDLQVKVQEATKNAEEKGQTNLVKSLRELADYIEHAGSLEDLEVARKRLFVYSCVSTVVAIGCGIWAAVKTCQKK